jgi:hypothetical protein
MSTPPRSIRPATRPLSAASMNARRMRLRNFLLLIAVLATFVAAGSWDNRRNMQHVLDQGYPVLVQITGAQPQRLAPFAIDGWRPRFVEQALSVDLKWDGRDGHPHTHAKVPVTEAFADTIVAGDQVRLAILPAKVLDDEQAVPVITADAAARFASVQQWLMASSWIAFAAWVGFGVLTVFFGRAGRATISAGPLPRASFPPRRTLFGIAMLVVGADGKPGKHIVQLSWKDARGTVHHFGPVPVSNDFWGKIAPDGNLSARQTRIRYREDTPQTRPQILDDPGGNESWQVQASLVGGLALMALGVAVLLSAALTVRRAGRG